VVGLVGEAASDEAGEEESEGTELALGGRLDDAEDEVRRRRKGMLKLGRRKVGKTGPEEVFLVSEPRPTMVCHRVTLFGCRDKKRSRNRTWRKRRDVPGKNR
jgi:hypothetical protein